MPRLDETAVNVVVDGSAKQKPRRGGAGIIVVWVDSSGNEATHEEILPYAYEGTTNNRMEIQAVIDALKLVSGRYSPVDPSAFGKIVVHTDSQYVADNVGNALYNWPKSKWRTTDDTPVLNSERWQELRKIIKRLWDQNRLRVDFVWSPGKRDELTRRVDKLAKRSADSPVRQQDVPTRVRRKWSPTAVRRGSIPMRRQEEVIRVVTDQYLRPQRVYRYLYEVIDPQSSDFGSLDYAFSEKLLNAGHLYKVRFNDQDSNPRIVDVLTEYPKEDFTLDQYRAGVPGPWVSDGG